MKFTACTLYLAFIGVLAHFIGQVVPRTRFNSDTFPFCSVAWERDGTVYKHLKIQLWKDKLPDMSTILSDMIPKRLSRQADLAEVECLIQETCVAEWIHVLLSVAGLLCLLIWPGIGGIVITSVWILLGNLPFILIQRYNRPRLKRLAHCLAAKSHIQISSGERNKLDACSNLDL